MYRSLPLCREGSAARCGEQSPCLRGDCTLVGQLAGLGAGEVRSKEPTEAVLVEVGASRGTLNRFQGGRRGAGARVLAYLVPESTGVASTTRRSRAGPAMVTVPLTSCQAPRLTRNRAV